MWSTALPCLFRSISFILSPSRKQHLDAFLQPFVTAGCTDRRQGGGGLAAAYCKEQANFQGARLDSAICLVKRNSILIKTRGSETQEFSHLYFILHLIYFCFSFHIHSPQSNPILLISSTPPNPHSQFFFLGGGLGLSQLTKCLAMYLTKKKKKSKRATGILNKLQCSVHPKIPGQGAFARNLFGRHFGSVSEWEKKRHMKRPGGPRHLKSSLIEGQGESMFWHKSQTQSPELYWEALPVLLSKNFSAAGTAKPRCSILTLASTTSPIMTSTRGSSSSRDDPNTLKTLRKEERAAGKLLVLLSHQSLHSHITPASASLLSPPPPPAADLYGFGTGTVFVSCDCSHPEVEGLVFICKMLCLIVFYGLSETGLVGLLCGRCFGRKRRVVVKRHLGGRFLEVDVGRRGFLGLSGQRKKKKNFQKSLVSLVHSRSDRPKGDEMMRERNFLHKLLKEPCQRGKFCGVTFESCHQFLRDVLENRLDHIPTSFFLSLSSSSCAQKIMYARSQFYKEKKKELDIWGQIGKITYLVLGLQFLHGYHHAHRDMLFSWAALLLERVAQNCCDRIGTQSGCVLRLDHCNGCDGLMPNGNAHMELWLECIYISSLKPVLFRMEAQSSAGGAGGPFCPTGHATWCVLLPNWNPTPFFLFFFFLLLSLIIIPLRATYHMVKSTIQKINSAEPGMLGPLGWLAQMEELEKAVVEQDKRAEERAKDFDKKFKQLKKLPSSGRRLIPPFLVRLPWLFLSTPLNSNSPHPLLPIPLNLLHFPHHFFILLSPRGFFFSFLFILLF
ncbi:hypothetical protein VP01_85g3 [Puccinia sorghi]|uniref:Uncharacterized protein n=1 Tax=Puccinia sorghi TaxID=27349 RepID=A0A0L6U8W9_9BASI|nr:hypothetical protein VP01_85g3 [Puccinia sorghi]